MVQYDSDAQADRTGGEQRDAFQSRRRIGRGLLIAGDILVLMAFLAPWANLYKIPSGIVPGEGLYSPLVVVWKSITNGAFLPAAGVLLPFVVILAGSLPLIVRSRDNHKQSLFPATLVVVAGLFSLLGALIFFPFLTTAVPLSYPYYDTSVEYGALVSIPAFASVMVGAALVGWE